MAHTAHLLTVLLVLLGPGCIETGGDCALERCEPWACGEPRPSCPCSDLCERPACAEVTVFARDPSADECVTFPSPCDVPDSWVYFVDPEQCASGFESCLGDGQCADGEICDFRSCSLDAVGACATRPEGCDAEGVPVWGCDGELYANDCERLLSGGRLDPVGGSSEEVCDAVGSWARDPASGACTFFSTSCHVPEGWERYLSREECAGGNCSGGPVWVPDAESGFCIELQSDCDVPMEAEYFESEEACGVVAMTAEASCDPLVGCGEGMVCDPGGCGIGAGSCVPLPSECIAMMESIDVQVCGCDGVSYSSDCDRLVAGVGLDHTGPCAHGAG